MAEGEERRHAAVVAAIAHVEPLAVARNADRSGVLRSGGILVKFGEGLGELARRIDGARQKIGDDRIRTHPGEAREQHGIGAVDPLGHLHRRTRKQHDDGVLGARSRLADEPLLRGRETDALPVPVLILHQAARPHADDVHIASGGIQECLSAVVTQKFGTIDAHRALEAHRKAAFPEACGEIELGLRPHNARRTAAREHGKILLPGRRIHPRNGQLFACRKGQHALVLEEHHALCRDLFGALRPFLDGERGPLPLLHPLAAGDQFEDVPRTFVERLVRKFSRRVIRLELFIIFGREGHLEIEPRHCRLGAVPDGKPIGDDRPVKAELLAQYPEALRVLGGKDAVDAVIGAHHGDGLCLAGDLEGTVIDLAQGALVNVARLVQPIVLQIVAAEVFEAHADAPSLHALDVCLGHLARHDGILGEVLKVAAVPRIALDVDAGRKQDIHGAVVALVGERFARPLGKFRVPGIGEHLHGGEGNGGDGRPLAPFLLHRPQPDGPVRDEDLHQFPVKVLGMPCVLAADEAQFFLHRKFFQFLHRNNSLQPAAKDRALILSYFTRNGRRCQEVPRKKAQHS